jgi:ABC-type branched-subunit amino acid transport system ATPase component/ABC-type branched-subunit amino acid transport system permease subunit
MSIYLLFLLLGLGAGAGYALLGVGLVLEHRSSRLVNMAHGALAMFCAYVYVGLRDDGRLVLPVVGLPGQITVSRQGLPVWPSILITLGYAAVLGAVVYLLIFRPLRRSSPLAKVVASIGLMIALQALALIRFGTTPRTTEPILPHAPIRVGSVILLQDRLWMAALAVGLSAVLAGVYRFSRFGVVTEALSENEKGAVLLGWSAHRISAINWALATVLAAVAGILLVPISSLDPGQYSLFVIPALGCLLVARMRSFGAVTVVGLALGMLQSLMTKLQAQFPALPQHGPREGIPFLLIIIALTVLGRRLQSSATDLDGHGVSLVGRNRPWWPPALAAGGVGVVAMTALHGAYRAGLIQSLITALMCCSLVILTGYVGQISLAQLAFAGLGGFAFAKLSQAWQLPLPLSLALAGLAAIPLGLLVGIPAVRIRGVQLAMVTLGAAVVVQELVFKNSSVLTGGYSGARVPPAHFAGVNLDIQAATAAGYPRLAFGLLVLALLAVVGGTLAHLRRTAAGRAMLAVKNNERAAASLGVDVSAVKLQAFVVAAAVAGMAGAVIGLQQGTLSAASFGVFGSLNLLAVAYIGGISRVTGAVLAGLLLADGGLQTVVLSHWIDFGQYQMLIVGVALTISAITAPTGIAGQMEQGNARLLARLRARRIALAGRRAGAAADGAPLADVLPLRPRVPVAARSGRSLPPEPRPASQLAETLLTVERLTDRRGGVLAIDDISLTIPRGSIVGLIGPNGAGKTTFIDAVTGFLPVDAGTIRLGPLDVSRLPPHRRARAGLTRTFQSAELFDELTVTDNIRVGIDPRGPIAHLRDFLRFDRHRHRDRIGWVLDLLDLTEHADKAPTDLSNGQRKLVAVARALVARPALVLLDEPAAGLDSSESRDLARRLRLARDAGITILLVDHDMALVLNVCDWIHVFDFGRLIASGPPAVISCDPAVLASYLGEPVEAVQASGAKQARTVGEPA